MSIVLDEIGEVNSILGSFSVTLTNTYSSGSSIINILKVSNIGGGWKQLPK